MKKHRKFISGVAVLSTISVGSTTHAEELQTTPATTDLSTVDVIGKPAPAQETTAQEAPKTAEALKPQVDEAQAKVETAQADVASAQNAVDAQNAVVESAEKALDTAKADEATAETAVKQAEELTKQATPENIAKAETAVTNAEQTAATAEAGVVTAKENADKATTALSEQEAVATKANTALETAQAEVDKATRVVSDAEVALDPRAKGQAENGVAELTRLVDQDTKAVETAKATLQDAEKAQANVDALVKERTKAVTQAEKEVADANSALSNQQVAMNKLVTERGAAQTALDQAKKGTEVKTTITEYEEVKTGGTVKVADGVVAPQFTSEYIELMRKVNRGEMSFDEFAQIFKDVNKDIATLPRKYVLGGTSNFPTDTFGRHMVQVLPINDTDTTRYNVDTLPKEVLVDTLMYATAVLNDIRSQVGAEPLVVTQDSIDNAINIVNNYLKSRPQNLTRTGWGNTARGTDSYERGIDEASLRSVIPTDSKVLVREASITGVKSDYSTQDFTSITRPQLKYRVLAEIFKGLEKYALNEYTSSSTTNKMNYAVQQFFGIGDTSKKAFGLDVLRFASGTPARDEWGTFFFTFTEPKGEELNNPYQTVTGATVTRKPVTKEVVKTVVDPKAVEEAQKRLDSATSAVTQGTGILNQLRTDVTVAEKALNEAKTALNAVKSDPTGLNTARKTLADAEAKLSYDKARLAKAQEILAKFQGDQAEKEQALVNAKAELAKAQEALYKVRAEQRPALVKLARLTTDKNNALKAVETAEQALTTANSDLATAKAQLEALKSATANFEQAKKVLETAVAVREAKSAIVDAEKAKLPKLLETLNGAKGILAEALTVYTPLKAEYDRLREIEELSKTHDVTVMPNGTVVAIPKVTRTEDGKVNFDIAQETHQLNDNKPTYSRVTRNNSLPNTGENSSLFGFIGLSLLAGLGYTGKRRKTR
ncbi:LPXTG cell wall anchor domain-containing protein [Streptococcus entericus]|uniref:LPXTG cell wall anchor domain-containing protein n=1 Tax=Streptococcus entericus TaxID=155680 RepID=UPI00037BD1F2|nr:LPXTG cell wall anchor domain-containing protein [Streptococcus entericus]